MTKAELLSQLTQMAANGTLQYTEVLEAFERGNTHQHEESKQGREHSRVKLSTMLYVLGGVIMFIGVSLFLQQHWGEFNSISRVLSTLGIGYAAYVLALILRREQKYTSASDGFFLLSSLVIPIGTSVLAHEAGADLSSLWIQNAIVLAAVLHIGFSFLLFKRTLLLFFFILYTTSFYITLTNLIIRDPIVDASLKLSAYRLMSIGVSYLFLTDVLNKSKHQWLSGLSVGFGTFFILVSLELLFPWSKEMHSVWEWVTPFVIAALLYVSTLLQSKSCLYLTSIYLIIYILQITSKYFAESVGWPIAIIGAGFLTIIVGYLSISVGKRFRPKAGL